ncbi:MAG TPA: hypothetical protein VFH73_14430 [Polyangia bacterium]|nr:hypothetical protein [Polyangia bacterium]
MPGFSELAEKAMMNLYRDHGHEVGSRYSCPAADERCHARVGGLVKTNCITYVFNVLAEAFDKAGMPSVRGELQKRRDRGTSVAKYLVDAQRWTALYYNPDVNHPRDAQAEHPYSYRRIRNGGDYYGIRIGAQLINYEPTPKTDPSFKSFSGLGLAAEATQQDLRLLQQCGRIRFGVGISRGGVHTWLFSSGFVYEVHWNQIGPALYERSPFKTYPFLSGVVVVPPDAPRIW